MVAQEGAFDEGGDVFLFVGGELVDGFELEPKRLVLRSAFVVVEEERVSADIQRERKSAKDVEGGLAATGFVAADLGDVGAGAVGELLLGERLPLARGGEAGSEVGVGHGLASWAMQRCRWGCCRGDHRCRLRVSLTMQSELGLF